MAAALPPAISLSLPFTGAPASALGDRKIVHMHEISVTVAAQRASSLRGLKLRLFWGQFYLFEYYFK
jgi:hypothetical protein